jgi:hypothetical protein
LISNDDHPPAEPAQIAVGFVSQNGCPPQATADLLHSLGVGSFGRFQEMIISPQNPHRLSLASFGASEFWC